jgi:hypothetical protein
MTTDDKMKLYDALQWENARVERVSIGSGYHDGRGFFTIMFAGDSWGQGIQNQPLHPEFIDNFIAACGASDLFDCVGKLVRVGRRENPSTFEPIVAVCHILGWDKMVEVAS